MKMKNALLLSLLLCMPRAYATGCIYVQSAQGSNATGQTTLSTTAITVTAGHLLVIYVSGPHIDAFTTGAVTFSGVSPTFAVNAGSQAQAITFTSAPGASATSATLTASFSGTTQSYVLIFSDNEQRYASFTNGSTAVSWSVGLSSSVTTSANYYNNQGIMGFYVPSAAGGSTTVTVNDTSADLNGVYVADYSGCATTSPLLAVAAGLIGGPGTGANSIVTGPMSTASTPGLVAGITWDVNKNLLTGDITAGTGYTLRGTQWASAAGFGWPEDEAPSSGTSFTMTWSPDSNAQFNTFASVGMAFKPASGGTATPPPLFVIQPSG